MQKSTSNKAKRFYIAHSDQHIDVIVRTCVSQFMYRSDLFSQARSHSRRLHSSRIVNSKLGAGEILLNLRAHHSQKLYLGK